MDLISGKAAPLSSVPSPSALLDTSSQDTQSSGKKHRRPPRRWWNGIFVTCGSLFARMHVLKTSSLPPPCSSGRRFCHYCKWEKGQKAGKLQVGFHPSKGFGPGCVLQCNKRFDQRGWRLKCRITQRFVWFIAVSPASKLTYGSKNCKQTVVGCNHLKIIKGRWCWKVKLLLLLQDEYVRLLGEGETETDRGAGGPGCSASATGRRSLDSPCHCNHGVLKLCFTWPTSAMTRLGF